MRGAVKRDFTLSVDGLSGAERLLWLFQDSSIALVFLVLLSRDVVVGMSLLISSLKPLPA